MFRKISFLFFLLATLRSGAQIPRPLHVVVVILENKNYHDIIDSAAAPYINWLAHDSHTAFFSNSFATHHPSQPNYLALYSGSNQGITTNVRPDSLPFKTPNLGASLLQKGFSFVGYSEDLPFAGSDTELTATYARRHNPWVNWQNSPVNGIPPECNQPLSAFPTDFNQLPEVAFIVPNNKNNMHDGADPLRIQRGDQWVHDHFDCYVQWAKSHNSVFILTFDEDDYDTVANHVVTYFLGQRVVKGTYPQTINHYSVLATIETMFHLPLAGLSDSMPPVLTCWKRGHVDTFTTSSVYNNQSFVVHPNPLGSYGFFTINSPLLSDSLPLQIILYDALGRDVSTLLLASPPMPMCGQMQVAINRRELSSAFYIFILKNGDSEIGRGKLVVAP